jgi:site-specific DNA-adenine methylase
MARHYGVPYMGSKQKLVDKIVPFIMKRHPDADSFYDLFGGGGSVSLYAVRKYPQLKVVYNERSKAISALMQHLREGGEIPTGFVTRAEFKARFEDDNWYAGLLQCAWTFGNNQKRYLYGVPIQDFKEALTELAMTGRGDIEWLEKTADDFNKRDYGKSVQTKIYLDSNRYSTSYQRRIVLARQISKVGALQHLARLERLLQIEKMPEIKNLNISAGMSYDEVPITGNKSIIYCDPPYEATEEYREGGFEHKTFYDWCMEQKAPVYISSYDVKDKRLKLVKSIKTRSLLNSSGSKKVRYNYENIYWNGVE